MAIQYNDLASYQTYTPSQAVAIVGEMRPQISEMVGIFFPNTEDRIVRLKDGEKFAVSETADVYPCEPEYVDSCSPSLPYKMKLENTKITQFRPPRLDLFDNITCDDLCRPIINENGLLIESKSQIQSFLLNEKIRWSDKLLATKMGAETYRMATTGQWYAGSQYSKGYLVDLKRDPGLTVDVSNTADSWANGSPVPMRHIDNILTIMSRNGANIGVADVIMSPQAYDALLMHMNGDILSSNSFTTQVRFTPEQITSNSVYGSGLTFKGTDRSGNRYWVSTHKICIIDPSDTEHKETIDVDFVPAGGLFILKNDAFYGRRVYSVLHDMETNQPIQTPVLYYQQYFKCEQRWKVGVVTELALHPKNINALAYMKVVPSTWVWDGRPSCLTCNDLNPIPPEP